MSPPVKKDNNSKSKSDLNKNSKGKDSSRQRGAEEALRKAAEEEAERQRQAVAAEEARLAAEKEEEQKLKNQAALEFHNADIQKDLISWVKSAPLSQACILRMDRAFSDGSLLAEIIHHFCPKICDNRQYFRWNSKFNKMCNWTALNNKVFPKFGFRLNQKQINNLLNPYQCGKFEKDCEHGIFIYKLLHRIRKELAQRNPKAMDYKKPNFVPPLYKKKPYIRKFVNFLENPPFSKVEMLLEQGFYDKEDVPTQKRSCENSSTDICLQTFGTFLPFDVSTNDSSRENGIEIGYNDICLQPTMSVEWGQPSSSYFIC